MCHCCLQFISVLTASRFRHNSIGQYNRAVDNITGSEITENIFFFFFFMFCFCVVYVVCLFVCWFVSCWLPCFAGVCFALLCNLSLFDIWCAVLRVIGSSSFGYLVLWGVHSGSCGIHILKKVICAIFELSALKKSSGRFSSCLRWRRHLSKVFP